MSESKHESPATAAPADSEGFAEWMRAALTQLCLTGPHTDERLPLGHDDVFSPAFTQRTNGQEMDPRAVADNMARLREGHEALDLDVLRVLREKDRYALHYRMHLRQHSGEVTTIETLQFGETDEHGRLVRIDEHVEPVAGAHDDDLP